VANNPQVAFSLNIFLDIVHFTTFAFSLSLIHSIRLSSK